MAGWRYFDTPRNVNANTMLLMTDGSVLIHTDGHRDRDWYRLTPDEAGRYHTGRWSRALPMAAGRLYFASGVLADGRVYAVGGEFVHAGGPAHNKQARGEIFDLRTGKWHPMHKPSPRYDFVARDCSSMVLADGRVLFAGPNGRRTAIWDPVKKPHWRRAGRGHPAGAQTKQGKCDEETWTLLPSGNVLTVQLDRTDTRNAEQYVPSIDKWVSAGHTTQNLVAREIMGWYSGEIGPAILLPSGKVIAIGGTGRTEIYTPDPDPEQPGTWAPGPPMPADPGPYSPEGAGYLTALDAPAVLLPSGKVICTGGPTREKKTDGGDTEYWSGPTQFLAYDPASTAVELQPLANQPRHHDGDTSSACLLLLPNGHVLYSCRRNTLGEYAPDRADLAAQASWRPRISTCPASLARGHTATITGVRFNGMSQANSYGDDFQSPTNFPLVRLTRGAGTVRYLRTFGFSSMGVATGSTEVTTEVEVPTDLPAGRWNLAVVANGIASPTRKVEIA